MQRELADSGQLIDVSSAMEFLREFRNGAFEKEKISAQAEILRSFIKRILVSGNQVTIEWYAGESSEIEGLDNVSFGGKKQGLPIKNNLASSRSQVSNVRTGFKLVRSERLFRAPALNPSLPFGATLKNALMAFLSNSREFSIPPPQTKTHLKPIIKEQRKND